MANDSPTEPITVRAAKETIAEIDAIADATDRSRNYVINQALRQYVEFNARQIAKIKEGIAAMEAGDVVDADVVFADIRKRHGLGR